MNSEPVADYEKYQQLVEQLAKSFSSAWTANAIWKEIEEIKSRHGGYPPSKPFLARLPSLRRARMLTQKERIKNE